MSASTITGPWSRATTSPAGGVDQVATNLAKTGQVDMLDGGNMQPKPSLAKATPTIYVSQSPTEMLVFQGQPTFTPITGTGLQWARTPLPMSSWIRAAAITTSWSPV